MKPYIFISFFVILCPFLGRSQVLYPPLNLQGENIECNVYLTWDMPELPGGGTPPGILGYNVYKEGNFFAYVSGQDTTWFYDIDPPPCPSIIHNYWVTAWYDLASYGNPGQFGESVSTDTVVVEVICSGVLPFIEHWDQASFSYNSWTFEPAQGNWAISSLLGDPAPSALFTGSPAAQNYTNLLLSPFLPSEFTTGCTDIFLDFDLKLDNLVNSGSEKMFVEVWICEEESDTVAIFENQAGFDWTHYHYVINEARGKRLEVGFRATGQNSGNILQWQVDNIAVTFRCRPPVNVNAVMDSTQVHLSWSHPECDNITEPWGIVIGYNIYRTDGSGMPPFYKINSAPITDTNYTDVISSVPLPHDFKYYITDLQNDTITGQFLCESEPSDTVFGLYAFIEPQGITRCKVWPNPNTGAFQTEVPLDAVSIEVSDLKGRTIFSKDLMQNNGQQIGINISGQPKGVYILTVTTKTGISRGKIVLY